jgi:hypothetical protein
LSRGFLQGTISFRVALIVDKLRVGVFAGREEIMTVPMILVILALTARSSDTDLPNVSVDLFTNFRTTQTIASLLQKWRIL